MISCLDGGNMKEMVSRLTELTDRYIDMFKRFAEKYNIYIIGGSLPVMRDGMIFNTAHRVHDGSKR